MDKIKKLRNKIDKIDIEILRLLNKRTKIAQDIGKAKKSKNLFRPERQANILKKLFRAKFNKISPRVVFSYWRSIFFSQTATQGGISLLTLKTIKKGEIHCIYDYFTQEICLQYFKTLSSAYKKLVNNDNKLLILPYPSSNGQGLWWTKYNFKESFITASLPFLIKKKDTPLLIIISKYLPTDKKDSDFLYISNSVIKNKNFFLVAKKDNKLLYKSKKKIENTSIQLIGLLPNNYEI